MKLIKVQNRIQSHCNSGETIETDLVLNHVVCIEPGENLNAVFTTKTMGWDFILIDKYDYGRLIFALEK